jgi:hypothetical protein
MFPPARSGAVNVRFQTVHARHAGRVCIDGRIKPGPPDVQISTRAKGKKAGRRTTGHVIGEMTARGSTPANRVAQMKNKQCAVSGGLKTSSHADAELQHIERAIGQLRAMSQKPSGALNVDYWRERLTAVSGEHVLVPAQRRRIDALRKVLDSFSQPPGGPVPGGKRSTNRLWAKAA